MKTVQNDGDVLTFLNHVENEIRKKDSFVLLELLESITQDTACMWGDSIIGFGSYHYVYKSGREGDWFLAGFSPRKQAMTIYMMGGFQQAEELLGKLGKHKRSKGCLYIKKLEDINMDVLAELITKSVMYLQKKYPAK